MPTIKQLPVATSIQASDLLPVSQGGTTRGLTIGGLLSSTQAAIALAQGKLLGRVSGTAGGPEPVDVGSGLAVSAGSLIADGSDHLGLPVATGLSVDGEVVVNSEGVAKRLGYGGLRALFSAGQGVSIDANGQISSTGAASTPATTNSLGLVQVGSGLSVSASGTLTPKFGTVAGTVADGGSLATTNAAVARAITIGGAPLLGPQTVALASAAGRSQADSSVLAASVSVVSAVSEGTGVMLPLQSRTTVVNRGSVGLNVYPPSGGRIEGGATNAAAQLPSGGAATFVTTDNVKFYAI